MQNSLRYFSKLLWAYLILIKPFCLHAENLKIKVPIEKNQSNDTSDRRENLENQTRDAMIYMMESLSHKSLEEKSLTAGEEKLFDYFLINENDLPNEELDFFAELSQKKNYLAVYSLLKRRNQNGLSAELIASFHRTYPLPNTLKEFTKLYPFRTWSCWQKKPSKIKGHRRDLCRSPDTHHPISVAQTIIEDEVRETEVIIKREGKSRHFSFAVYNKEGLLSDESEFQTVKNKSVILKSPYVCITCHYNSKNRSFN